MTRRRRRLSVGAGCVAGAALATAAPAAAASATFLGPLYTVAKLASTVPGNGDVNPYGVAVVPRSMGRLHEGSVLVSNFNAKSNLQGTGTTIVQISPTGRRTVFAKLTMRQVPGGCPGGIGLTTALSVLPSGWVIVGSLPTKDGTPMTARAGCLLVLDSAGTVREALSNRFINGPRDMTAVIHGAHTLLFVTNVLNGTVAANGATVHRGTVVRIALRVSPGRLPKVSRPVVIGSGFAEHTDPAALVVGPTGVAFDSETNTLYVADTAANRITAIPEAEGRRTSAGTGRTVTRDGQLENPLGLVVAPDQHLISTNAGNGRVVETTTLELLK